MTDVHDNFEPLLGLYLVLRRLSADGKGTEKQASEKARSLSGFASKGDDELSSWHDVALSYSLVDHRKHQDDRVACLDSFLS